MSLLEDVFLHDETNEAHELEKIIEGGDYERVVSNSEDNSEKEDEAEEDKRRVDPGSTKTKKIVKNPRFILNPARLTGPRGIQVIPEHFKDFKFKGKGHEKEDLDLVLKKLEHWAYRLYPKFKFEDCLKKIETLGKKRPVMVHLQKIRSDQFLSDELVVQKDSSEEETAEPEPDEFDKLLQQQIELARATPAPQSRSIDASVENRSPAMPKATSSPSMNEEQRERMLRNRKLAEERRLARLNNSTNYAPDSPKTQTLLEANDVIEGTTKHIDRTEIDNADKINEECKINFTENVSQHMKHKSNSLDSSDEMSEGEINIVSKVHNDKDRKKIESQEHKRKANIINSSDDENDGHCSLSIDTQNNEQKSVKSASINQKNNLPHTKIELKENATIKQYENDEFNTSSRIDIRDIVLENSIIQRTIQGLVENENNINLERDLNNHAVNSLEIGPTDINEQNEAIMDVDFNDDF